MHVIDIGLAIVGVVTQRWTPPHYVMGYSFAEWFALLSILTVFLAVITWFIRVVIVSPLNAQISILSSKINEMNKDRERDAQITSNMLSEQGKMLRDHERQLVKHGEDIKTLFKQGDRE